MIEKGDYIGETIITCYNCNKDVEVDIIATENNDEIGTIDASVCPYCNYKL